MGDRADVYMRDSDAFSWYMEDDPVLRSTVVTVMLFDRPPDWDRLWDRLDRASRLTPGFRHRIVRPPMRLTTPRWVVDPDFDLSWHVRRFEAAEPRTLETVLEFARKTGMAGLDRDRPLWEYTFIDGLEGGRTAAVMKIHHALTDGVGGMQMARFLFDTDPDPGDLGPMPEAPEAERIDSFGIVRDALGHDWSLLSGLPRRVVTTAVGEAARLAQHPRRTITDAIETARSVGRMVAPATQTLSPLMTDRHSSWHYDVLEFGVDDMRRTAHALDATFNDGFLAGVTGGLRRYHVRHDAPVDELRVTMPISIRRPDDPIGGNRITLARFTVPVGTADPKERIALTHERCEAVKAERSLPLTNTVAATLNLLPRSYIGGMLKHVDFLASNVPGIPVPFYLAGARVVRFYGFGPTIGAAVNLTLLSYCGTCFVGINVDNGAVPDPDVLLECLQEGFEETLAIGGIHRRVELPTRAA